MGEDSGVKYMWVYRTSGHTQSFARYSVSDTGGLKEEIHTDVLAASYNGESTDEFNKYRIYFNGPSNSAAHYQCDYDYDLLEVSWGEMLDYEVRAMAVQYFELEPEPEPEPE